MYAANKIDSFALTIDEKLIIAGTYKGELLSIDIESFSVVERNQFHLGSISAVASHPNHPYICCLGLDNFISILSYNEQGHLKLAHQVRIRDIKPDGDEFLPNTSTSQAINFHPTRLRIATRTGAGALLELEFDEESYEIVNCCRLHDNWDLISTQYTGNDVDLLSATNRGDIILSNHGDVLKQWALHEKVDYNTTHWMEKIENQRYALANDCCKIIFIDLNGDLDDILIGPQVAIDHLEHVTFNPSTQKLFSASFDRTIIEVDVNTGEKLRTIWHAPFKCRWIKNLSLHPDILIVQCRNGGLYKVSISTGSVLASFKETPQALWSGELQNNQEIIIAGEGSHYYTYKVSGKCRRSGTPLFTRYETQLDEDNTTYTKRLYLQGDMIVFGRVNGNVIISQSNKKNSVVNCESAIRDLVIDQSKENIYVICENGTLTRISVNDFQKEELFVADSPLWSIALNHKKQLLALGARKTALYLYDLNNQTANKIPLGFGFIKRMKWLDEKYLLMSRGGYLVKFNVESRTEEVLCAVENTIEDFSWDIEKKYLVLVSYTRNIYLCDFQTGTIIHEHGGAIDYLKGCLFVDSLPDASKGDFLVFGRDGVPFYHRINDERIISFMPITNHNIGG